MKKQILFYLFILGLGLTFFSSAIANPGPSDIFFRKSVVKLFVNGNPPDFFKPWQNLGSEQTTGSGCIIEGNRILTSAHVISDSTFIEVKKSANPKKFTATVEAVGHDADLAILTVDDPSFFEGTKPVPLGNLPMLRDTVVVIGFPRGGDQLSITEGVVSRIDVTPYSHSSRALLAIQIDAAINPGNSGGPVMQDGEIVGIAFQGLKESENIGYMIPAPIIRHFLKDLNDGNYDGFPTLGVVTNKTDNKDMRSFYGLKEGKGGVLISEVVPGSPAAKHLKKGDVITSMDGVAIASDRTVEFRENERILFIYLLNKKQIGDTLPLKVIREGKEIEVSVELEPYQNLVPLPYAYEKPPYYIYGGLVFTVLSKDLLRSWDSDWGAQALVNLNYYNAGPGRLRPKEREEVSILLNVLPDKLNVGYHDFRLQVVDTINGKQIQSFKDLARVLDSGQEPITKITTEEGAQIILNHEKVLKANPTILEKYSIPSIASSDIQAFLKS